LITSPRERVLKAVEHREIDRVPRGELLVEEGFLDRIYPNESHATWREKMGRLVEETGLDLVTLRFGPEAGERELEGLDWWVAQSDRFVAVLLDGLFWQPTDSVPFASYLLGMKNEDRSFRSLLEQKQEQATKWIEECLAHGAHGCLIGDDIAYDRGPFASPEDLEKWIFPRLRELAQMIKERGGIALLHSCGNLGSIFDQILSLGFHGLHGLAPSAGNDLVAAHGKAEGRMALLGGVDVDGRQPDEIATFKAEKLAALGTGGGYIMGSSSGLSAQTPLDSFRALYDLPMP
jgi:uroporphyrinogen decarboxylase